MCTKKCKRSDGKPLGGKKFILLLHPMRRREKGKHFGGGNSNWKEFCNRNWDWWPWGPTKEERGGKEWGGDIVIKNITKGRKG